MNLKLHLIAGAALMLMCGQAFATIIAEEKFDYTVPNTVDGLNGGEGWSGAWRDLYDLGGQTAHTFDVVSPGETYTSNTGQFLPGVQGNAIIEDEQNTGSDVEGSLIRRSFDNTGLYGDGTETWIRYIANINISGSHGFAFANSDSNFGTQVYRVGGNFWRLHIGGDTVDSTINSGGQTLVIIKISHFDADLSDSVRVWFNPDDIYNEPLDGSEDLVLNGLNIGANNQVRFSAGNFPTSVTYDELVIATSFSSAIPEPASILLLALGGLMVTARTRPLC